MGPDATLARIRQIYQRVGRGMVESYDLEELAELCMALDGHMSRGGFPPADWAVETEKAPPLPGSTYCLEQRSTLKYGLQACHKPAGHPPPHDWEEIPE